MFDNEARSICSLLCKNVQDVLVPGPIAGVFDNIDHEAKSALPSAQTVLPAHVPEMGITVFPVLELDTGGERWMRIRVGFTWGFDISGWE